MNRRRFLAATLAVPFVFQIDSAHAGGWASIRLEEPLPVVIAGEPFVVRFTVHGHDMDDAMASGLAISIALKHRETKEIVRFSLPERRTAEPVYEMGLTVEESGAYKWTIQAEPYSPLPMPTLHVLDPGSDPSTFLTEPEPGDVAAEVLIDAQLYTPNQVTIAAGEAVIWENEDEMTHQVAWQDLQLDDSNLIKPGESLTMTFDRAGTFQYFCGPHPWMTGTVEVV